MPCFAYPSLAHFRNIIGSRNNTDRQDFFKMLSTQTNIHAKACTHKTNNRPSPGLVGKKILFTFWHPTLLFSTPWLSVEGEQVACHAFADSRPNTPEIHQCKRCFQSIFQAFHKCSYCESARTIKGWVWLPDIVVHTIPVRDQEDLVMIVCFWIFSVQIGVKVQLHLSHTSL